MSRHAKNNTASAVFTHYERSKLKYGTQKQRLGKDSQKHFDSCSLCLQPVIDPLSCHKGHIFCKECIYENLLSQKKDIKRQKKLYEAQQQQFREQGEAEEKKRKEAEIQAFDKIETGLLPQKHNVFRPLNEDGSTSTTVTPAPSSSNALALIDNNKKSTGNNGNSAPVFQDEEKPKLQAYWVPSLTPSATDKPIEAPPKEPRCTEGNHPLKLKQLVIVRFTPNSTKTEQEDPKHVYNARYCCPVCRRTLTDSVKAVIFKSCGHVQCLSCCEKFSNDKICTVCDKPYREVDVIKLQSGGTGFSSHDDNIEATKITPTPWL